MSNWDKWKYQHKNLRFAVYGLLTSNHRADNWNCAIIMVSCLVFKISWTCNKLKDTQTLWTTKEQTKADNWDDAIMSLCLVVQFGEHITHNWTTQKMSILHKTNQRATKDNYDDAKMSSWLSSCLSKIGPRITKGTNPIYHHSQPEHLSGAHSETRL